MRVTCLIVLLMVGWMSVDGQADQKFPEYTPERIGETRREFANNGEFEKGINYFRSWEIAKGTPETNVDSAAWYSIKVAIGNLFLDLRWIDSVEAVIAPVLNVSASRFPDQCVAILHTYGVRLIYGGQFVAAKDHYIELINRIDTGEIPAPPDRFARIVHNLGVVHGQLGDTDAALESYHRVERMIEEYQIDNKHLVSLVHFAMSGAYSQLNDYEQALHHSRIAYQMDLEMFGYDHVSTALSLNAVGNNLKMTGNVNEALATYEDVLNIYRRMGRTKHPNYSITLLNLAETLDKDDRSEEALPFIRESNRIRLASYGLHHANVARGYKSMGTILSHLGRYDQAIDCIDTAIIALGYRPDLEHPYAGVDAMFNLFYTMDHRADIYYVMAIKHPSEENLRKAFIAYNQGIQVLNDLRLHYKGKLTRGTLNDKAYTLYEPAIDVCLRIYDITGDLNFIERALAWSSESKDNNFYNQIRATGDYAKGLIPDSVATRLESVVKDIAILESQWQSAFDSESKDVASIKYQLDSTHHVYRNLVSSLEINYPKYYELLYNNKSLDLLELHQTLQHLNANLVEYFIGDENAFAFVVTISDVKGIRLESPREIISKVMAWKDNITGTDKDVLEVLSKTMWSEINYALDQEIQKIVVVPDGVVHAIPCEILLDKSHRMLAERYAVSYWLSSREAPGSRHAHRHPKWLGVAPEYESEGEPIAMASRGLDSASSSLRDVEWIRLPGAEKEVRSISRMTSGQMLTGQEATEQAFRSRCGNFNLLHLSMHAWTDDDEPLLSGLIFSHDTADTNMDGRLYTHEVMQMDIPSNLVVLSACNTGVGRFRRGEGLSSLARAFHYSGADATLMSLWKVPDESTSLIMESFYEYLKQGKAKDVALQMAKSDYRQEVKEPELQSPYYWAGFILVGDVSPVYPMKIPRNMIAILGCAVLAVGAVFVLRKRKADLS